MSSPPNVSLLAGDLSWYSAALISSWIVGPLYGINICVFILCVQVLHLKGLKGPNLMMLIVASVQFALATGHITILLVQLSRAYIDTAGTLDESSQYLFGGPSPEEVALEALYITNSLIGDAILIWRLWVIWNRNLWLCLPFIVLCTATAVAGYTAIAHIAQLPATGNVFIARIRNWMVATWSLSIATQFGATLLISYRVWTTIQWNRTGTQASRRAILGTLVESGALYTVTTILLLGFSRMTIGPIFAAALGQISALAPTLIIARSGLKSLGSLSSFKPEKGSINNAYHSPARHLPQDLESRPRECEAIVVHIRKATEVPLDELAPRDCGGSSSDERSSVIKLIQLRRFPGVYFGVGWHYSSDSGCDGLRGVRTDFRAARRGASWKHRFSASGRNLRLNTLVSISTNPSGRPITAATLECLFLNSPMSPDLREAWYQRARKP